MCGIRSHSFVLGKEMGRSLSFQQAIDLFVGSFENLSKTKVSDKYHADDF